MLKKLVTLLLSILACLSLLPGQALAADPPEPSATPAIVETLDPEEPGGPEAPVMPMGEEVPDEEHYHI